MRRQKVRFTLTFPTPARIRKAWQELKKRRADPDPIADRKAFDTAWAGGKKLSPTSDEFQDGQQPHQLIMAEQLEFSYNARSKALEAVTKEREGYLNTFVLLIAAIGLVAQKQVQDLIDSSYALLVWVPAVAIWMLLRSHASKLSALLDNYDGPGARVAHITTRYLFVNELRETVARRDSEMQHAKRNLAMVCLIYQLCIVGVCAYVTLATLIHLFG